MGPRPEAGAGELCVAPWRRYRTLQWAPMQIAQLLFSQGFGTRRACAGLVAAGAVSIAGRVIDDPSEEVSTDALIFHVDGKPWPYRASALVMMNKPAGYECSQKPKHHASVLSLLPPPLRQRGVQPIGRLDEDTTGLLLFTDDGKLIHRLTSPKHHVPKVYEIGTKHPATDALVQALLKGVVLDDDPAPVRAEGCELIDNHHVRMTLVMGKYHQVKRMVAAAGNRVETLHRSRYGALNLPSNLPSGGWAWIDVDALYAAPVTDSAGAPAPDQVDTTSAAR